jgi:methionyl-tRNA formyltransferase
MKQINISNLNDKKIKIVFMGTPQFAADILDELLKKNYNIVAVFTQPDKKVGRKQEISFLPVKALALENKIRIFQPDSLRKKENIERIREINPGLIIVAAYGKILPREILEIPKFNCLNVHASLLPKFRGASPIQNAILAGEKETGVTLMLMNERMDAGDILAQNRVKIRATDTTENLAKKLSSLGAKNIIENLPGWLSGKIKPKRQDADQATFCRAIRREDGIVNWRETAQSIYDQWRAFQPWPGIYTLAKLRNGNRRIKLVEIAVDPTAENGEKPGKVIEYNHKYAVQTGKGIVFLEKVQLEGKKTISISDFRRGYPEFIMVG